ncbi:MAG TPA: divergent polysaccharide deacetylase family protein [Candidatus Cloacimonadota bacterium]|nr:divergent polysaccharide deacetylase family protein [Candidatus Cloacimonadota bacterium]
MKMLKFVVVIMMLFVIILFVTSCKKKEKQTPTQVQTPQPKEEKAPEQPKESKGNVKVALVIDDFGSNGGALLESFCKLDPKVSFAIIPGLDYSKTAMKKGVASGHETIIHIPMQPLDYPKNDPGKNAILLAMNTDEITKRVEDYIDELPYCIGANNHMGSAVTGNMDDMKAVLKVLKKHDMFFLDSATTPTSIVTEAANAVGIPEAKRRIFLDVPDSSPENTAKKVKDVEKIGTTSGTVIVIGHCHNQKKLEQIQSFIKQIKGLGYELIPISKAMPKHGEAV